MQLFENDYLINHLQPTYPMKRILLIVVTAMFCSVAYSQNGNSKKSKDFSNNGDTFIQKKNLVVNKNLYVLQNFELSGYLKAEGTSYFQSKLSVGSFAEPTEMLDVFGNAKVRGTILTEFIDIERSATVGEDLTVGNNLTVGNFGYFAKVGIGKTGALTEALEVEGNALISQKMTSNSLESGSGVITNDFQIGGQLSTTGNGLFNSNVIVDGMVGIGTDPTEKLDVAGNIKATENINSASVTTTDLETDQAVINNTLQTIGVATFENSVNISGATDISNTLNVSEEAVFANRVGIGVTAPSESLDVAGNIKASETLISTNIETSRILADEISGRTDLTITSTTNLEQNLTVAGDATIEGNTVTNGLLGVGKTPTKELDVLGDAEISNNLIAKSIESESFTTDDLSVNNTMTVGGVSTLNDNLVVNGNSTISGTLGVSQAVSFDNSLTVQQQATLNADLSVAGNSYLSGKLGIGKTAVKELDVVGDAEISQKLTAQSIESKNFATDDLDVSNTLKVGGASTLSGILAVDGATTMGDGLSVSGVTNLNNNLLVTGTTSLDGSLTVANRTTLNDNLQVVGNADITGNLSAASIESENFTTDDLTVNNNLGVSGASTMNTLNVSGATSLNGLEVSGAGVFSSTLSATGATTLGNTLTVAQTGSFQNNLDVTNNATIGGTLDAASITSDNFTTDDLTVNNNLGVSGASTMNTLNVSGATTLNGLQVSSAGVFSSTLSATGATTLGSTLIVTETGTFQNNLDVTNNATIGGILDATSITSENFTADELSVTNTLDVAGASTLNTLNVSETTSLNELEVTGAGTFNGTLSAIGATTLNSTLTVTENGTFKNDINVTNNATIGGTLDAASITSENFTTDELSVTNTLDVAGGTTLNTLNVTGTTSLNELAVAGAGAIDGTLSATGATTLNSTLTVTEKGDFQNDIDVANNVTIGGTLDASSITSDNSTTDDLTVSNDLNVQGASSLTNLNVSGASALSNTLTVSGATTLNQSLAVTGASTFSDVLTVTGKATLEDDLEVTGDLSISGDLSANSVEVEGFTTNTIEAEEIIVNHDATVSGNLEITGNIGMGIANPQEKLHIDGGIKVTEGITSSYISSTAGTFNKINTLEIINDASDQSLVFGTQGVSRMTLLANGNLGIGTANASGMLTVAGEIHAQRVKVEIDAGTGPDYVFADNYDLMTLKEVEKYIQENSHLPEVPTAKEMESEGVELAQMNMLLLKKLEELTLHQIELLKRIEELESKVVENK